LLNERNLNIADEVAKIAATLGTTPTAVALAWVWQRPGVTSLIIGPRTIDQLDGNLTGLALDLPLEAVTRLDEVSQSAGITPVTGMNTRHGQGDNPGISQGRQADWDQM
jgi:aryl-alcohol dehydrogenase-like predicted oxidoreductase